ncbi:MAG: sulfite exporter TauE/SafE family protein [Methylotenera sp.]|nr:sulfite exporter TauE/SafE family protein [Oligoflexia bacterium]
MLALSSSFLLIALLYSMVGFGGGSSYAAILAASGVAYTAIPKISLLCNLLVVTGGSYHFGRQGHFSWKLILPFAVASVPMAFAGGMLPLDKQTFFLLMTGALVLCGLRILFLPDRRPEEIRTPSIAVSLLVGGVLGLLSGLVGIGGGIFLSPLLINLGWARSKNAAAVASVFILVNSLAGLAGQFTKNPDMAPLISHWPLFAAVFIGGQVGSRVGSHQSVPHAWVQKSTGILTLFIGIKLLVDAVHPSH